MKRAKKAKKTAKAARGSKAASEAVIVSAREGYDIVGSRAADGTWLVLPLPYPVVLWRVNGASVEPITLGGEAPAGVVWAIRTPAGSVFYGSEGEGSIDAWLRVAHGDPDKPEQAPGTV